MLDLKLIRREPETVKAALARRDPALRSSVDEIVRLDAAWRSATAAAESRRAEQRAAGEDAKAAGKELGQARRRIAEGEREGRDVGADRESERRALESLEGAKRIAAEVKALAGQAQEADQRLREALARLPNLPDQTAADGPEDELVRVVGEPSQLTFEPRDHIDLAGQLIDMEKAATLSGTRFAYLKGDLVMVELALVGYALRKLSSHGFQPVIPPVLVRERALYGTGFLPDTEQQIYRVPDDDLYLVGTSEVALASLHDGELIEADRLPLRYAGLSPCFRREAGAAGRDTRGIFRVHQFDKVEMFSFVAPEASAAEHERILSIEEEILADLQIPYRVVNIAVGDLGASAAKKYDCEAWLPSQGRYRELTSCSNTTDYQARRLGIRVRGGGEGGGNEPLHTLNGTAVAVGRTLIALLENGQREDGSVALPERLVELGAPAVIHQRG